MGYWNGPTWVVSILRCSFTSIGFPIMKLRQSHKCPVGFIIRILIPEKSLYIETGLLYMYISKSWKVEVTGSSIEVVCFCTKNYQHFPYVAINLLSRFLDKNQLPYLGSIIPMMSSPLSSDINNAGSLQWHHNGHSGVSNHQPHNCFLNRLFRLRYGNWFATILLWTEHLLISTKVFKMKSFSDLLLIFCENIFLFPVCKACLLHSYALNGTHPTYYSLHLL